MKSKVRGSLALGAVLSVVAVGGATAFGADSALPKAERNVINSEEGGAGFGGRRAMPGMRPEGAEAPDFGENFTLRINSHMSDFGWAVESGIISQETADKISAYMTEEAESMMAEIKSDMEIRKNLSDEERMELKEYKKERKDMFEKLVEEGIITQTEADALKEAMPAQMPQRVQTRVSMGGMNLETFVEEGVISQSEADNIKEYMSQKIEAMKSEMDSLKEEMKQKMDGNAGLTEENRKELFGGTRGTVGIKEPLDILGELVEKGIITQSQAEAIKERTPQRGQKQEASKPAVLESSVENI